MVPSTQTPNTYGRSSRTSRRAWAIKALLVGLALSLLAFLFAGIDLRRGLSRINVGIYSGASGGNYARIVDGISNRAAREGGVVRNVHTDGSADNLLRLTATSRGCAIPFGLVQDGSDIADTSLRLVARLPRYESLFLLTRQSERYPSLASLRGARIGVGPERSGTARLVRELMSLPELSELGVTFAFGNTSAQIGEARSGALDIVALVVDEDSDLIATAMRGTGLEMIGLSHADVLARRLPYLKHGRIGAGQYDPVSVVPKTDRRVLRVETLLVARPCAPRSQVVDLLLGAQRQFPELMRHNKETPNRTGLELSPAAKSFFDSDGPDPLDAYAPWLVDLIPPANFAYIVMALSLLFNAMGLGHRFMLWRIDAARVRIEAEVKKLFGPLTPAEIATRTRSESVDASAEVTDVRALCVELEDLLVRSRRQSLSVLVPMGQEMAYRYQEDLIRETLWALREFLRVRDAHPERV